MDVYYFFIDTGRGMSFLKFLMHKTGSKMPEHLKKEIKRHKFYTHSRIYFVQVPY